MPYSNQPIPASSSSYSHGSTTSRVFPSTPSPPSIAQIQSAFACPPPFNITHIQFEAVKCVRQNHGIFYDGCRGHCEREMSFLRLSQNLELENFVYGYLFPALVLFVVVANLLVVLVLSQKHMVTPTNVVLKYMAIADMCVGLVPLPWNFFYHTLRYNEREQKELQLWWCYMYKYSMDAIPPVCHNIAMWLTVLLAGQRYISIEYPMNSRHICNVRSVRLATVVITIVSIVCGLPKSFDYYFSVYEGWAFEGPNQWVYLRSCLSGFTASVKLIGSNAFFNAYFWTRVFGFIVLPSLLLICLNALLIRSIRQAQKRKKRLLREKRAREAQRQTDSNSTSIMLVIIVSIFLLVNLPQALFMAMLCVYNTLGIGNRLLEGLFPVTFLLVSNMLVMATYPINFGIYCFMSSSFRHTFRMLFCKGKPHRLGSETNCHTTAGEFTTRMSVVRRSDPSVQFSAGARLSSSAGPNGRHVSSASMTTSSMAGGGVNSGQAMPSPSLPLLAAIAQKDPVSKSYANGCLLELNNDHVRQFPSPAQDFDDTDEGPPVSPTSTIPGDTIFL